MAIETLFSWNQKAEKWVSHVVLVGCVLISAGLVYLYTSVSALGEEWVEGREVSEILKS